MTEDICREFIIETRLSNQGESDQKKGLPQPRLESEHTNLDAMIKLPKPDSIDVKPVSLREAIEERESVRIYSGEGLTLGELSWLLWCTQGVKKVVRKGSSDPHAHQVQADLTLRTVPSAGARHPLETHLLVNHVEGLKPGVYKFIATEHGLSPVGSDTDLLDRVSKACPGQRQVANSAVTFIWSAVPYRMSWRHGRRGYRYLFLEAGHVCQNLYLAAEAVDCGVCAIGVYHDEELGDILGLDEEAQFVIYCATVGKRRSTQPI